MQQQVLKERTLSTWMEQIFCHWNVIRQHLWYISLIVLSTGSVLSTMVKLQGR